MTPVSDMPLSRHRVLPLFTIVLAVVGFIVVSIYLPVAN
jgi:hypothetical protein